VPDSDDSPDPTVPPAPVGPGADVRALDVDGVGAVLVGTIAWTVALVVCLLMRDRLAADGRTWWTWVCATGALVGLPGLWFVRRRSAAYAAARPH
jgi:hypothetical protein